MAVYSGFSHLFPELAQPPSCQVAASLSIGFHVLSRNK